MRFFSIRVKYPLWRGRGPLWLGLVSAYVMFSRHSRSQINRVGGSPQAAQVPSMNDTSKAQATQIWHGIGHFRVPCTSVSKRV